MAGENEKLRVATNLPDPPELTDADYQRMDDEAKRWRDAYTARTADMEVITADDLKVRAR